MDKKSADVVVTVALYKVNDKGFRGWLALNFKGDLQKNFFTEVGLTGTVLQWFEASSTLAVE